MDNKDQEGPKNVFTIDVANASQEELIMLGSENNLDTSSSLSVSKNKKREEQRRQIRRAGGVTALLLQKQNELDGLNDQLKGAVADLNKLRQEQEAISQAIKEREQALSETDTALQEVEAEMAKTEDLLDQVDENLSLIDEQIAEADRQIDQKKDDLAKYYESEQFEKDFQHRMDLEERANQGDMEAQKELDELGPMCSDLSGEYANLSGAQKRKELETKQADACNEKLKALKEKAEKLLDNAKDIKDEISELRDRLEEVENSIDSKTEEIRALKEQIKAKTEEIKELQEELKDVMKPVACDAPADDIDDNIQTDGNGWIAMPDGDLSIDIFEADAQPAHETIPEDRIGANGLSSPVEAPMTITDAVSCTISAEEGSGEIAPDWDTSDWNTPVVETAPETKPATDETASPAQGTKTEAATAPSKDQSSQDIKILSTIYNRAADSPDGNKNATSLENGEADTKAEAGAETETDAETNTDSEIPDNPSLQWNTAQEWVDKNISSIIEQIENNGGSFTMDDMMKMKERHNLSQEHIDKLVKKLEDEGYEANDGHTLKETFNRDGMPASRNAGSQIKGAFTQAAAPDQTKPAPQPDQNRDLEHTITIDTGMRA